MRAKSASQRYDALHDQSYSIFDRSGSSQDCEGSLESCAQRKKGPSSWKRSTIWMKIFLRAFGFQILGRALGSIRNPLGKGHHEKTKVAISRNRSTALLRALIHLVPVGVALFEIILNWNTYYVGATSHNQAVYQALAKAHEIMIQASLATIVLTYVRNELALGHGIPFGLLFSGLQITQLSYLWSLEFWGSIRIKTSRPNSKTTLLLLVPISIILATACGPSSVILLIPREQFWPGGSTDIWINATESEIWPAQ